MHTRGERLKTDKAVLWGLALRDGYMRDCECLGIALS